VVVVVENGSDQKIRAILEILDQPIRNEADILKKNDAENIPLRNDLYTKFLQRYYDNIDDALIVGAQLNPVLSRCWHLQFSRSFLPWP